MQEVAIVGAGELGGALAHVLARRDVARRIRLIDDNGRIAEGKALDIAQAAPVEQFAAMVSGSSDVASCAGADVIVLADRAGAAEWQGEDALQLVRRLTRSTSTAVIVCAGAAQREVVDAAVRELRVARTRLFGSAPEALAGGARALVALAMNASPRDVSVSILGVPPDHTVVPWEEAAVAGLALTRLVDEPSRRRLAARIGALWPPGPYALATAAAMVVEAVAGKSRRTASCFVAPDLSSGRRSRTGAMPVRLGPAGIAQIIVPTLTVLESVALDNAMQV